jgi:uncharacterized membrane protein YgcG
MVTIDLDFYDMETEVAVTATRSGLNREDAYRIVGIVRDFRASGAYQQLPTLRACVIMGRVLANQNQRPSADNPFFMQVCMDVLGGKAAYVAPSDERYAKTRKLLMDLVRHHCGETRGGAQFSGLVPEANYEQEPIVNDALLIGLGLAPSVRPSDEEPQLPLTGDLPSAESVPANGTGRNSTGHSGTGHSGTGHNGTGHSGNGFNGNGHSGSGYSGTGHSSTGHSPLDKEE